MGSTNSRFTYCIRADVEYPPTEAREKKHVGRCKMYNSDGGNLSWCSHCAQHTEIPENTGDGSPWDLAISFTGYLPKTYDLTASERYPQSPEQQLSQGGHHHVVDKESIKYIHSRILAIKEDEILLYAAKLDGNWRTLTAK